MRKCSDMPYHIGVRMKIYLSDEQKRIVNANIGAQRSVYNHLVAWNNEIYIINKEVERLCACTNDLALSLIRERISRIRYLKQIISDTKNIQNALPFIHEQTIDVQVLHNGLRNYRIAWKNMKNTHSGIPTFHARSYDGSYQTNCHYTSGADSLSDGSVRLLDRNHIVLPKIRRVRFGASPKVISRLLANPDDTRIGTVTISRDALGEYWASLQISSEHPFHERMERTGKRAGMDLNINELANLSDDSSIENVRILRNNEHMLRKAQRRLSRRKESCKKRKASALSSRNYQKQRKRLARMHRRIARRRDDYLNAVAKNIVGNYDFIAAEKLQKKNLMKNHQLAKSIADCSWGKLTTLIEEKARIYGKTFVLVAPQYTTQTCNVCSYVMKDREKLPLSAREWTCPRCGTHHSRDTNAAINILNRSLKSQCAAVRI